MEDSATELYLLKHLFAAAPDMEVAGTASDGREALALLPRLKPDLVITSVIFGMPAAAIELGAAQYVLPSDAIAAMLVRLTER